MKSLSGVYNLSTYQMLDDSQNVSKFKDNDFEVLILGQVFSESGLNCFEEIVKLYEDYSYKITSVISGLYILMIHDIKKEQVVVFHDRYTSPVTLYYVFTGNAFYYSTSLKELLIRSAIKRKMNESVIEEFLVNGFIYGEQTLIENVYKIKAFHCLLVNKSGTEQVPVNYSQEEYSKEYALDHFKEVLDKAILKQINQNETEVNTALSGGYDSSYIANVLSRETELPINAFSIGGKFGKNELPTVEKNVEFFPRTKLYTALTDSDTLQHFPDIVWRLEGNVFEAGLFLQYELNRLVKMCDKSSLICGECADQILNVYFFDGDRNEVRTKGESVTYYEFSEYPYIFGSYLILKKNGILANSFDIETRYPYLDNEFATICKALSSYNGKNKRAHKENCHKKLPEEVVGNISKIAGSTDCHSLFEGKEEVLRFFKYVEKSSFYKKHRGMIKKHSYGQKVKPDLYEGVKTAIRDFLYGILKKEIDRTGMYFNEEMKLREYLNCAYLILFNELFISGHYDKDFHVQSINYSFEFYMKKENL